MNTSLFHDLIACGVRLWVEGETLMVDAPVGIVTPALKESLKAHKEVILAFLTTQPVGFGDAVPVPKPLEFLTAWNSIQRTGCPSCGDVLDLSARGRDGAPDVWWCSGCRVFV